MLRFKKILPLLFCSLMPLAGHAAGAEDGGPYGTHTKRLTHTEETKILEIGKGPGFMHGKVSAMQEILATAGILTEDQRLTAADCRNIAASASGSTTPSGSQCVSNPALWLDGALANRGVRLLNDTVFFGTDAQPIDDLKALIQKVMTGETVFVAPTYIAAVHKAQLGVLAFLEADAQNTAPAVPGNALSRNTPFADGEGNDVSPSAMLTTPNLWAFFENPDQAGDVLTRLVRIYHASEEERGTLADFTDEARFGAISVDAATVHGLNYMDRPAPTFAARLRMARAYLWTQYMGLGENRRYYAGGAGVVGVAAILYLLQDYATYAVRGLVG